MPQDNKPDFADFVREFAHGSINRTITERLSEVVAACQATNTKGSITLKFTIDAKQGLAEIKANVSAKKPEPALPGAHYYTNEAGDLLDEDPRQMKFNPKVIDAPAAPRIVPATRTTTQEG